eukprot:3133507-Alexandrium_andersonii.AAC.1
MTIGVIPPRILYTRTPESGLVNRSSKQRGPSRRPGRSAPGCPVVLDDRVTPKDRDFCARSVVSCNMHWHRMLSTQR